MIDWRIIGYENTLLRDKAYALAQELGLIVEKDASTCLFVSERGLALKQPSFSLLYPDFLNIQKRQQEGKKQGLIRACKPVSGLKILDVTAGWGRDAALLASFGAQVLMLERSPIMGALLRDAIERQAPDNLSLQMQDAFSYLESLSESEYPDVIYMDPMHPVRQKSALVKKDMQALQQMIGPDEDALALLLLAKQRKKNKVVLKWPQKERSLLTPSASIEGKTVRFDLFF